MARLTVTLSSSDKTIAVVHMDTEMGVGGSRAVKVTVESDKTKKPATIANIEIRESKPAESTWRLIRRVADALDMAAEVGGE